MWNPDVYMTYGDLRTRPALELASRCVAKGGIVDFGGDGGLIYDLGCGPGNSTNILAALNPTAQIIGKAPEKSSYLP